MNENSTNIDPELPESRSLLGKQALVAGAGRGIGLSAALDIARMGARVLCVARSSGDLARTLELLPGEGHEVLSLDLGCARGRELLLDRLGSWGFPHVVVANLHVRRPNAELAGGKPAFSAENMLENMQYLLDIIPECLRRQRSDGFGRWIAVSSVVASMGGPGQALYGAHKNMLASLFRTLATEEGGNNITANIIEAGIIDTPGIRENYPEEVFNKLARMNLMGRAGRPEEVAHAIAFFAGPLASYVTGVTLPVCGGYDLSWGLKHLVQEVKEARRNSAAKKERT